MAPHSHISWIRTSPGLTARHWAHGWTTTAGPDFRSLAESRQQAAAMSELAAAVRLPELAWCTQVHGDTVLRVDGPGPAGSADALWTDRPGLGVVGRGADCPLLLIGGQRDDGTCLWGFAHASWRSTVLGITGKLLTVLIEAGGVPASLTGVICPSAGPCCYEVGTEVRDAALAQQGPAADPWFTRRGERLVLDLWRANLDQWQGLGLAPDRLAVDGHCTLCGDGSFPSHRRDGAKAGRFAAVIGWPDQ